MEFSRQEYLGWSLFPSLGNPPNPVIKTRTLALQADSLLSELSGKPHMSLQFSHSVVSDSLRSHGYQGSLSIAKSQSLLKLMCIESVKPSNHLILCRPLLLLPSIFLSIRVFSNESALCIRWPKYWSFSFSISPFNEYSGLISFRMYCFHLLAIQGTLKSLLQQHSSKASILWRSAFFIVQLLHPYMTTRKTLPLTSWTFVGKIMSLLFNMLSRLVTPSAVILEPPKNNVCLCFHYFPLFIHLFAMK